MKASVKQCQTTLFTATPGILNKRVTAHTNAANKIVFVPKAVISSDDQNIGNARIP